MQKLSCQEIRDKWIEFFTQKVELQHQHIKSASLVPDNPTLLLNAAGMVQFVPIFMGTKPAPQPPRAVTVQKCARVGGKDSDLENIGRTNRHHSFFEMLGNFSFGDYFKKEAIAMAWRFITEELEMPKEKLYVTVFEGDELNDFDQEAYDYWLETLKQDFSEQEAQTRIWKMSRKDNFWGPPGATGPCGPCSEIYFDLSQDSSKLASVFSDDERRAISEEEFDSRFTEIWNLVFMQLNKDEHGKFTALENKNIDTGAGLERIATILQGVNNSFETNELFDIVSSLARELGFKYGQDPEKDLYLKIIADHLRCLCFLIADGIRPSNLGRGYVLRMIIRRAARFVYLLKGEAGEFLYNFVDKIKENYSFAYPELIQNSDSIKSTCLSEEKAFAKTILNGSQRLNDKLAELNKGDVLDGEFSFDLYSTYGFPLELTCEIAQEKHIKVDEDGYHAARKQHSEVSNSGNFDTSVSANSEIAKILKESGETKFLGYDSLEAKVKVIAVISQDQDRIKVVLDKSPFYAESGGQLADKGNLGNFELVDVKKIEGVFVHSIKADEEIKLGDELIARVDADNRRLSRIHHSAEHLLLAALRKVLGDGVQQMGSQVGPEYTRFDFNLDRGLTKDEQKQVEDLINAWIKKALPVQTKIMQLDEAEAAGALSFFEEKYEDEVRVLFMGDDTEMASIELCGGTHVSNTAEIEKVVMVSEGSVAAGVRRIKMLATSLADDFIKEREEKESQRIAEEKAKEKAKAEAKAMLKQQSKLALEKADEILATAKDKDGVQTLVFNSTDFFVEALEAEVLKTLVEALLSKIEAGGAKAFILAASASSGKVAFIAAASQDLVKDKNSPYNASNAVKKAAQICGGGGGGRPNFAQAGAKDASKIQEAISAFLL